MRGIDTGPSGSPAVPYVGPPGEELQLRLGLAKLLVELEAVGITDPHELRRRAIEELIFNAPERDAARPLR